MFSEDQLLPISALQHLLFCERQCALIHVERQWAENRFTVEGQHVHRKAHRSGDEWRGSVRIVRSLWLRSFQLGIVGQADVVEFEFEPGVDKSAARFDARAATDEGPWRPPGLHRITPVEYKRGRPKANNSDRVQLCAQALCLEEMLGLAIATGCLFYGKRQHRTPVEFDAALRAATATTAARLHQMISARETPPAICAKKCDTCSLINLCLPDVTQTSRSASRFVGRQFASLLSDGAPATDPFDFTGCNP